MNHTTMISEITYSTADFAVFDIALGILEWVVHARLWNLAKRLKKRAEFIDLSIRNGKNGLRTFVHRMGDGHLRLCFLSPFATHQVGDLMDISAHAHGSRIGSSPARYGRHRAIKR